ncbi:hypothetical protein DMN91_012182 [Ooceraea biroi]|uniref:52 kDa repressor of the inhibitor of the protein kinase n=1 Tax=Ooceraea biroi TaxID=2015173 RepID=A0A026WHB4_OOCBI|nr:52 kDa repressor of the inhibitor of the protein kinase [Ooceraea biroi]XP_011338516.1 52 kDa repressor of the inhibitor of the protein kinase [Ooceraea biroi]EZA54464.1 52 kDa repressor of the inhibitor of the protein kinase [Ooceraea biroi]RLU15188.1 hypothetical protein DMN91_012182 [Ooceraea biroi]
MTEKPKKNPWCVVPECTRHFSLEGRHFFKFPKEHDRWLQWVRACGRTDLEPKGPLYAHQNCRLCNLHFEDKWLKLNKVRARLHPDAVPTRFFGPPFGPKIQVVKGNIVIEDENEDKEDAKEKENTEQKEEETNESTTDVEIIESPSVQDTDNNVLQSSQALSTNVKTQTKPSTSNTVLVAISSPSKDGLQKKKLRFKLVKLKPIQDKALLESIRQLQQTNKPT